MIWDPPSLSQRISAPSHAEPRHVGFGQNLTIVPPYNLTVLFLEYIPLFIPTLRQTPSQNDLQLSTYASFFHYMYPNSLDNPVVHNHEVLLEMKEVSKYVEVERKIELENLSVVIQDQE